MAKKPNRNDIARWQAHVRLAQALADCRALGSAAVDVGLTENIAQGHMEPAEEPGHYRLTDTGRQLVEAMKDAGGEVGR